MDMILTALGIIVGTILYRIITDSYCDDNEHIECSKSHNVWYITIKR